MKCMIFSLKIVWVIIIQENMVALIVNGSIWITFLIEENPQKKSYAKYKFCPPQRVKKKLKINYKLELQISYTTTKICMEIVARDGVGLENLESLV